MRVNRRPPGTDGEEGAIAIIVAITLLLFMGLLAVTVDAGQLWTQRRTLVKATDAAALDAAQQGARGGSPCAVVGTRLAANAAVDGDACTAGTTGAASWVRVEAQRTVDFAFAPVFGVASEQVRSASTARWGAPLQASGLRPFGACATHPDLAGVGAGSAGTTIRLVIGSSGEATCDADAPGQFLWWDFDGGSNSTPELRDWVLNGYDGEIAVGDEVEGAPGARNALESAVRSLASRRQEIVVPLYDTLSGSGATARYRVAGFLGAVVTDVKMGGGGEDYVEVEVAPTLVDGDCCGPPTSDFGVATIELCAIDAMDPRARCGS